MHPCPANLGQSGVRLRIISGMRTHLAQKLSIGTIDQCIYRANLYVKALLLSPLLELSNKFST